MTKTFVTPHNGKHVPATEKNTLPSMTVPDEALSLRQIFQKFANGEPLEGKDEVYFPETIYHNVYKMDLADVETLMDIAKADQQEAAEKLDAEVTRRKMKRQQQKKQDTPQPPANTETTPQE